MKRIIFGIFMYLLCCTGYLAAQEYLNPYVEKSTQENVIISKVVIEKNRTVLYLQVKNTSTSNNFNFTLAGTDMREAHYIYDPAQGKKYLQKFVMFSDVSCCQSTRFSVYPVSSQTVKIVFQKLDQGVRSFDLYEGTNSGNSNSWDFKGVKLMNEGELAVYKQKKDVEESARMQKEKEENEMKLEQENKRKAEYARNEEERKRKEDAARQEEDNQRVARLEEYSKKAAVTKMDFDGAYVEGNGKIYFVKPSGVYLARFGRCIGSISDFDLIRTYCISDLSTSIVVSTASKKITLIGPQYAGNPGDYKVSELRNLRKDLAMCAWNLTTDQEIRSNIPTWGPKRGSDIYTTVDVLDVKVKSISSVKAEVFITDPLVKNTYYVLYNSKNSKYFIIYVK